MTSRNQSVGVWTRRSVLLAAFLLSALAVSLLVLQASRAAFSDTTDNTGNAFSTGTVILSDDDTGTAMFNVTNMVPGDTATACIAVTYSGTVADPSAVKLYSGGYTDSGTLADYLNVTVEEGTGGSFADCSGFVSGATIVSGTTVAGFDTSYTDYASGAGTWDPASTPESRTYRVTVELDAATPNAQQGASVTALAFVWEVQS